MHRNRRHNIISERMNDQHRDQVVSLTTKSECKSIYKMHAFVISIKQTLNECLCAQRVHDNIFICARHPCKMKSAVHTFVNIKFRLFDVRI